MRILKWTLDLGTSWLYEWLFWILCIDGCRSIAELLLTEKVSFASSGFEDLFLLLKSLFSIVIIPFVFGYKILMFLKFLTLIWFSLFLIIILLHILIIPDTIKNINIYVPKTINADRIFPLTIIDI